MMLRNASCQRHFQLMFLPFLIRHVLLQQTLKSRVMPGIFHMAEFKGDDIFMYSFGAQINFTFKVRVLFGDRLTHRAFHSANGQSGRLRCPFDDNLPCIGPEFRKIVLSNFLFLYNTKRLIFEFLILTTKYLFSFPQIFNYLSPCMDNYLGGIPPVHHIQIFTDQLI
jgi:hypothetical protein